VFTLCIADELWKNSNKTTEIAVLVKQTTVLLFNFAVFSNDSAKKL
jgi:hypothetical protein